MKRPTKEEAIDNALKNIESAEYWLNVNAVHAERASAHASTARAWIALADHLVPGWAQ